MTSVRPLVLLWDNAGFVTRAVLSILGVLLIGGLCVLLRGLHRQHVLARQARTVATDFWVAPNLYEALKRLEADSVYRRIAQTGLEAVRHTDRLTDRIGMSEWITLSLDRAVRELSDRLHGGARALVLIVPVAVAVGAAGAAWTLAGSVFGSAVRNAREGLPLNVGEALWMGMLGLVVAVTAAVGYGWLVQRNARATGRVRAFAAAIRALLLSADRSTFNESSGKAAPLPARDRIDTGMSQVRTDVISRR